jgi:hypothetical protein
MALMRNNYNFTIIWTMVFIAFFAYFFVTASIVGFEDGFDQTVNEKGYPEDFENVSAWTWKETIIWTVSWMQRTPLQTTFDGIVTKIGYKTGGGKGLDDPNESEKHKQHHHE